MKVRSLILIALCAIIQACAHTKGTRMQVDPGQSFSYGEGDYLNYVVHGNGERPLVFLHGFAASLLTWSDITPLLSRDKYKIYLVDLKGAGFSSKPRNSDYSLQYNAEIITAFIKTKNLRNPVLVGHSFGGGVALLTALNLQQVPDYRPSGIVLIDLAAYKIDLPFFVKYLRLPLLSKIMLSVLPADFQARYTLKRVYYDKEKITDRIVSRYSYFLSSPGYNDALIATADQVLPDNFEYYTAQYRDISAPSLIIWGDNDRAIPLSTGIRLSEELKNSRLVVIPNCGHNPHEEWPEKTASLIDEFVSSLR